MKLLILSRVPYDGDSNKSISSEEQEEETNVLGDTDVSNMENNRQSQVRQNIFLQWILLIKVVFAVCSYRLLCSIYSAL